MTVVYNISGHNFTSACH